MTTAEYDLYHYLLWCCSCIDALKKKNCLSSYIKNFEVDRILYKKLENIDRDAYHKTMDDMRYQKHLNNYLLEEFSALTQAAEQKGIEFIYCKGIPLAIDLYDPIETRKVNDIDILVGLEDLEPMLDILDCLAYIQEATGEPVNREMVRQVYESSVISELGELARCVKEEGRDIYLSVDLHVSLFKKRWYDGVMDTKNLMSASVREVINGQNVRLLELHDKIIHLLVHFAENHTYDGFVWMFQGKKVYTNVFRLHDIALMVDKYRSMIDWSYIIERSKQLKVCANVAFTARLFDRIYPDRIPQYAIVALKQAAVNQYAFFSELALPMEQIFPLLLEIDPDVIIQNELSLFLTEILPLLQSSEGRKNGDIDASYRKPQEGIFIPKHSAETEYFQPRAEWNQTERNYEREHLLHRLVESQVDHTPNVIAITFEGTRLTYQELNHRANQLAHYLQKRHVGPDVLVGVYLERSVEMIVSLLGILKAGGAYVPFDPEYPQERITFMLQDTQVPVLLTLAKWRSFFAEQTNVICLDEDWDAIAQENSQNPHIEMQPAHLSYVMYTSGSTGQPKGVMNTHLGICNRLLWMQDKYRLTEQDRVLQKTPFSFDVSIWEFFWPLITGAQLVIAQPGGHRDSTYLVSLIQQQSITTIHFVPSMLHAFLKELGVERCTSLKQVMCSGEVLPFDLQQCFFARLSHVELHNLYGPTEAAIDVTSWVCRQDSDLTVVPIGRPIANIQIHLLDELMRPVPVGIPGEIYIGGRGVARGYWKCPMLTKEKFIPDPFSDQPEARLYKTGDLARYLPSGAIEFLGRNDNQVKIRGFRIELGEIEAVIKTHPSVQEAVVLVKKDASEQPYLVAYVVKQREHINMVSDLRSSLRRKLPLYMLPAVVMTLETFPLTPSGKIDRNALPEPMALSENAEGSLPSSCTPTEAILVKIWAEIFGRDAVDVHDNFFDLGGDSLIGIQMVAKARQSGLHLIPDLIFQHQTVAELASAIDMNDEKAFKVGN